MQYHGESKSLSESWNDTSKDMGLGYSYRSEGVTFDQTIENVERIHICETPLFLSNDLTKRSKKQPKNSSEIKNCIVNVMSLMGCDKDVKASAFEIVGVKKIIPKEGTDMSYPSYRNKRRESTLIIIPMESRGCFLQIFPYHNRNGKVIFIPHNEFVVVTKHNCLDVGYGIQEREDGWATDGTETLGILEIELSLLGDRNLSNNAPERKNHQQHGVTAFWMKKHYGVMPRPAKSPTEAIQQHKGMKITKIFSELISCYNAIWARERKSHGKEDAEDTNEVTHKRNMKRKRIE